MCLDNNKESAAMQRVLITSHPLQQSTELNSFHVHRFVTACFLRRLPVVLLSIFFLSWCFSAACFCDRSWVGQMLFFQCEARCLPLASPLSTVGKPAACHLHVQPSLIAERTRNQPGVCTLCQEANCPDGLFV